MTDNLSQPDMVLIAASKSEGEITQEELVVRAWQNFPAVFGLKGFESQYPNSNKVICNLVGARGLVAQKLLDKPRPGVYRLSAHAPQRLAVIRGDDTPKQQTTPAPPSARNDKFRDTVKPLFQTFAYAKTQMGRAHRITQSDADEFRKIDRTLDVERESLIDSARGLCRDAADEKLLRVLLDVRNHLRLNFPIGREKESKVMA